MTDTLLSKVNTLSDQLKEKDAQIKALEHQVDKLEEVVDGAEQYSRRTNLRFQGVPESEKTLTRWFCK